ncbi:MAG: DUF2304 domain-containing protein [Clostridia bacterium]|nr:DUF2304 domain-containing protein [Clostridia bacterium]
MSLVLQIFLIICVLAFIGVIIRYLVLKKLNLKYTLVWLLAAVFMLTIAIFPQIITWLTKLVGIQVASNAVFFFAILFLFLIVLTLTAIVSHMNNRVYRLTQMQALLEKRVRELETKLEEQNKK